MFARSPEPLEREAERLGGRPVAGDVTGADDVSRLVQTAVDAFGSVDILINNSGGPPRTAAVGLTAEQVEAAVQLLLVSVVRLTDLCLPHLERSGHGRIINVTSSTVKEPTDNLVLSNAVRPGVVGWAKTLSREVGPKGITVNSIAPGWIDTERIREVHPEGPSGRTTCAPSLSAGSAPRARSATSSRSSAPIEPPTSPEPSSPSTAASYAGFIESPQRSPVKRFAGIAVALGVVGLVTAFTLWILPAEEFIFTPHEAKPLAERIQVEGSHPREDGGVYYVDVFVRRTTRLEDLFPFLRPEGSTVVPEEAILPSGTSEDERDRQTAAQMNRSELVASAVALRELGYDVVAKPQGRSSSTLRPMLPRRRSSSPETSSSRWTAPR